MNRLLLPFLGISKPTNQFYLWKRAIAQLLKIPVGTARLGLPLEHAPVSVAYEKRIFVPKQLRKRIVIAKLDRLILRRA